MSRIGIQPIPKPSAVTAAVSNRVLTVTGPLGALTLNVPRTIDVQCADDAITVRRLGETKQAKSNHGTIRAHIQNMVNGVTDGFVKEMELVGMGYRASMEGQTLVMSLGWNHPIKVEPPPGLTFEVTDNVLIKVKGADIQQVGLWAAKIRHYRKPEPYKGKGIMYKGEVIRRKTSKSVKEAA